MKQLIYYFLPVLFLGNSLHAQRDIVGFINDGGGFPLPGATIEIEGTDIYNVSDINGQFTILAQETFPFFLKIRFVGYKTRLVRIDELPGMPLEIPLTYDNILNEVVVTSRRRKESAQEVPIPVSVVSGAILEESGAFNVNRVKELVPTVQLYSSNPRNTTLNIRGLGSTFGLTNDGIDPGVGFYVDGVYYARPAVTTLDFIDVEQIEVLRGPQGTLFGKNTTAGAFNITTRAPSFTAGASFEVSYGNYGFVQAKSYLTGPLIKDKLAGRFSFSGTQRDGTIYNLASNEFVNDLNNLGLRGQLLFTPSKNIKITLSADASRQRPNGYAQVVAGIVTTQRPEFRQFRNIIADLNYSLPSENPFDRLIDHDTPWHSKNDLGGVSLNFGIALGSGSITSTTAWRYWNWGPSNDRDFTGLPVLTLSQAPSKHKNWSQEIRWAGNFSSSLSGVIGVFAIGQDLKSDPFHTEQSGAAQWRFSQNTQDPLWETPGLLDGYGIRTTNNLESFSGAIFANIDWTIADNLHILPGLRYTYDTKDVDFKRETFGGLQTDDPALLAIKNRVFSNQAFTSEVEDDNVSGQLTVAYKAAKNVNTFATYSTSYKPVGVNLGGLPTEGGQPILELAEVKPEFVTHVELGVKTNPTANSTLNLVFHNTRVRDFQTLVQTPELGVNRGFLANAERVRVLGLELDGTIRVNDNLSFSGALAFSDSEYVSFTNAPVPLEEVGGAQAFKDISGGELPGISKWAGSVNGEVTSNPTTFLGRGGEFFLGLDTFFRSSFSSSPSPSRFLNIDGYSLLNGRIGFRASDGLSVILWGRNLFDKDYFEQLLPAGGSAGHYAGVLGDPGTYGATLRYSF